MYIQLIVKAKLIQNHIYASTHANMVFHTALARIKLFCCNSARDTLPSCDPLDKCLHRVLRKEPACALPGPRGFGYCAVASCSLSHRRPWQGQFGTAPQRWPGAPGRARTGAARWRAPGLDEPREGEPTRRRVPAGFQPFPHRPGR